MIPVYPARAGAQSSGFWPSNPVTAPSSSSSLHVHSNRPGNYWGYLFLVAVAAAVAYEKVRPIGLEVSAVFQRLIDAFQYGR
jgi:hypothetical protein